MAVSSRRPLLALHEDRSAVAGPPSVRAVPNELHAVERNCRAASEPSGRPSRPTPSQRGCGLSPGHESPDDLGVDPADGVELVGPVGGVRGPGRARWPRGVPTRRAWRSPGLAASLRQCPLWSWQSGKDRPGRWSGVHGRAASHRGRALALRDGDAPPAGRPHGGRHRNEWHASQNEAPIEQGPSAEHDPPSRTPLLCSSPRGHGGERGAGGHPVLRSLAVSLVTVVRRLGLAPPAAP